MERKEIIVKTYEQLVRAVEILEADIIIVSGMIACAGRPIYLRSGQIVRGADKFSGLKFNFEDQARSVIFLEEFSKVQNLKIDVAANSYPSADRMQAVFEINGRCAVLENIFAEIKVYESRAHGNKPSPQAAACGDGLFPLPRLLRCSGGLLSTGNVTIGFLRGQTDLRRRKNSRV